MMISRILTTFRHSFSYDCLFLEAVCHGSVSLLMGLFLFFLRAVHFTDFTSDHYQIMTASDDYTCRVWDIPNATAVTTYKEHTDYIRCGVTSKLNGDLFITGEMVVLVLASSSHMQDV